MSRPTGNTMFSRGNDHEKYKTWMANDSNSHGLANWEKTQEKVFTRWVNTHLSERGLSVTNLFTDFSDGLRLHALLEVLTGKEIRINRAPKMRIHCLENVNVCLDFLRREGLVLTGIGADNIVDGDKKLTFGLVWSLIEHFQIKMNASNVEEEVRRASVRLDQRMNAQQQYQTGQFGQPEFGNSSTSATHTMQYNEPLQVHTQQDGSPKNNLLEWIRFKIPEYDIQNFSTSWSSGKALCALVNAVLPNTLSIPICFSNDPFTDCALGLNTAHERLGLPILLDPNDLIYDPDELSLMTYLSYFRDFSILPQVFLRKVKERTTVPFTVPNSSSQQPQHNALVNDPSSMNLSYQPQSQPTQTQQQYPPQSPQPVLSQQPMTAQGGNQYGQQYFDPNNVTMDQYSTYAKNFALKVPDGAFMSGPLAFEVFSLSGLSRQDLGAIWVLVDPAGKGSLELTQFAAASHLIASRQQGAELPTALHPSLIASIKTCSKSLQPTSIPSNSTPQPQQGYPPSGYPPSSANSPQQQQQPSQPGYPPHSNQPPPPTNPNSTPQQQQQPAFPPSGYPPNAGNQSQNPPSAYPPNSSAPQQSGSSSQLVYQPQHQQQPSGYPPNSQQARSNAYVGPLPPNQPNANAQSIPSGYTPSNASSASSPQQQQNQVGYPPNSQQANQSGGYPPNSQQQSGAYPANANQQQQASYQQQHAQPQYPANSNQQQQGYSQQGMTQQGSQQFAPNTQQQPQQSTQMQSTQQGYQQQQGMVPQNQYMQPNNQLGMVQQQQPQQGMPQQYQQPVQTQQGMVQQQPSQQQQMMPPQQQQYQTMQPQQGLMQQQPSQGMMQVQPQQGMMQQQTSQGMMQVQPQQQQMTPQPQQYQTMQPQQMMPQHQQQYQTMQQQPSQGMMQVQPQQGMMQQQTSQGMMQVQQPQHQQPMQQMVQQGGMMTMQPQQGMMTMQPQQGMMVQQHSGMMIQQQPGLVVQQQGMVMQTAMAVPMQTMVVQQPAQVIVQQQQPQVTTITKTRVVQDAGPKRFTPKKVEGSRTVVVKK